VGRKGRELARRLIEQRPDLRVLFTSGDPDKIIGHDGVLNEGVHFIPKPYTLDTLAARIRKVLDR